MRDATIISQDRFPRVSIADIHEYDNIFVVRPLRTGIFCCLYTTSPRHFVLTPQTDNTDKII